MDLISTWTITSFGSKDQQLDVENRTTSARERCHKPTTGPDGKKVKGVYWANLQLQFNGQRKKGQSFLFLINLFSSSTSGQLKS